MEDAAGAAASGSETGTAGTPAAAGGELFDCLAVAAGEAAAELAGGSANEEQSKRVWRRQGPMMMTNDPVGDKFRPRAEFYTGKRGSPCDDAWPGRVNHCTCKPNDQQAGHEARNSCPPENSQEGGFRRQSCSDAAQLTVGGKIGRHGGRAMSTC